MGENISSNKISHFIVSVLNKRRIIITLIQVFIIFLSYISAFLLRFDFQIPQNERLLILQTLPMLLICRLIPYYIFKLNSGWWRFVSMQDLVNITKAIIMGTVLFLLGLVFIYGLGAHPYPRSVVILETLLNFLFIGGIRFSVRWFRESLTDVNPKQNKHVLIVGAGQAGTQLLREIRMNSKLGINVVGFIDDNPFKKGIYIHGIKVLGTRKDIPSVVKKLNVDEIFLSIPSAGFQKIKTIISEIKNIGIPVKTLPSISELIHQNGLWKQLKHVDPDDLLGRPILRFRRENDILLLSREIMDQVVMVTGAGGSIGSELCRQIVQHRPRALILYERGETALYMLELELKRKFPDCNLMPIIGDILNDSKLNKIISSQKVNLIYHAAAYKHVPMMERDPFEAVRNNIIATDRLAKCALNNNVSKFIYISTDKAVNPTNIMGATKRIGELIMQVLSGGQTKFISVRFGNVLGSNGSVIPLFKEQIESGGPVTITHPETTRYFMAISEAVQLVMTAAAMGQGGEIFLLDMGEPVKIADMANKLIKSSGLEPLRDIEIKYIGMRPGEKLHEELYWKGENVIPTENKKITRLKTNAVDKEFLFSQLKCLEEILAKNDGEKIFEIFKELIPESKLAITNGKTNGINHVTQSQIEILQKTDAI